MNVPFDGLGVDSNVVEAVLAAGVGDVWGDGVVVVGSVVIRSFWCIEVTCSGVFVVTIDPSNNEIILCNWNKENVQ